MKPDFILRLGEFQFRNMEVPASLPFGGDQIVNTHIQPGGKRTIDVMGAVERDRAWSGIFRGRDAMARAAQLDAMRIAGAELTLSWADRIEQVVILSFEPDTERLYFIPYRITCMVVSNRALKKPEGQLDVHAMIKGDLSDVTVRSGRVGHGGLIGAVANLSAAVRGVSDFAVATAAEIERVAAPLREARDMVRGVVAVVDSIGHDPIRAIMAGDLENLADLGDGFADQLANLNQLTDLRAMDGLLARMDTNLQAVGTSGAHVQQAGGDLYRLAVDMYGDATAWVDIARANGLVDPVVDGIVDLTVPERQSSADGVLTAAPGF